MDNESAGGGGADPESWYGIVLALDASSQSLRRGGLAEIITPPKPGRGLTYASAGVARHGNCRWDPGAADGLG